MTVIKCANAKEFILKRVIRLYPVYISAVLLTFLLTSFYYIEDIKVSAQHFVINLTMLQNIVPGYYVKNVDGSYWSLAVEITFYLICAILLSIGLIKKPILICILWLSSLFFLKFLYSMEIFFPVVMKIGDMEIVKYSHLFVAGIAFYQLKNLKSLISKYSLSYHLIIIISFFYNIKFNGNQSSIFVGAFYVIFYLLLMNKLKFLNTKLFTFLGSISYSLYLLHQNVGYIIIKSLENVGLSNQVFIIIPIIISITLASIFHFYIEKPIQNWSLSKLKTRTNTKVIPMLYHSNK